MSDKTKNDIYEYIQKYLHQRQEHDYIDYYELFGLSEDATIDEIQKELKTKKIRKLFHPDQIAYIESIFKDAFEECVSTVINAEKTFSNDSEKMKYDMELSNNKNLCKDRISEKNKNMLEIAIETTIYDKGFYNGFKALTRAINNDFNYVTTANNSKKMIEELGADEIKKILNSEKKDIMNDNIDDIIMDYYIKIINKIGLKEKTDSFYNICRETVKNNELDAYEAIFKYVKKKSCRYFIKDERLQNDFKKNKFSANDIVILMASNLHSKSDIKDEYSFSNILKLKRNDLTSMFVNQIKDELKVKNEYKTV